MDADKGHRFTLAKCDEGCRGERLSHLIFLCIWHKANNLHAQGHCDNQLSLQDCTSSTGRAEKIAHLNILSPLIGGKEFHQHVGRVSVFRAAVAKANLPLKALCAA